MLVRCSRRRRLQRFEFAGCEATASEASVGGTNKKSQLISVGLFVVCVRQNLVFRAIFESVSDDKYFLLPCVNKKKTTTRFIG